MYFFLCAVFSAPRSLGSDFSPLNVRFFSTCMFLTSFIRSVLFLFLTFFPFVATNSLIFLLHFLMCNSECSGSPMWVCVTRSFVVTSEVFVRSVVIVGQLQRNRSAFMTHGAVEEGVRPCLYTKSKTKNNSKLVSNMKCTIQNAIMLHVDQQCLGLIKLLCAAVFRIQKARKKHKSKACENISAFSDRNCLILYEHRIFRP